MRRVLWIVGLATVAIVVLLTRGNDRRAEPPPREADPAPAAPAVVPEPPEEHNEDGRTVLTGRVVRASSREPVAGATVNFEPTGGVVASASTRPDGRFRVTIPPDDEAAPVLVVRKYGFAALRAVPLDSTPDGSHEVGDLVLRPAWTVRGAVRGEEGEPVPGARIRFCSVEPDAAAASQAGTLGEVEAYRWVESDLDGHFLLEGASDRPFFLRVVATGYVTGWFGGATSPGNARIELRLRRGHDARIRVVDGTGAPVAGARVNLYPGYRTRFAGHYKHHHSLDRSTETDTDGRCVLTGLDERNYRVTAQVPGPLSSVGPADPPPPSGPPPAAKPDRTGPPRGGAADAFLLAGGPELVLELRHDWFSRSNSYGDGPGDDDPPPWSNSPFVWVHSGPPRPRPTAAKPKKNEKPTPSPAPKKERKPPPDTAWFRFRILSADGVPMPDVHIRVRGPRSDSEITDEDGRESFSLPPGSYDYRLSPLDFGTEEADVRGTLELRGGETTEVDLTMPRIWSVRVAVRDPQGRPLSRVRVIALRGDEDEQEWTDENGEKLLFADQGEPLSLLALPKGLPTASRREIPIPPRGPVVLRVPSTGVIAGRVLDPSGHPLFGVRVTARREGLEPFGESEVWRAWTDSRGSFRVRGPAAGPYTVTAHHAAFSVAATSVAAGDATACTLRLTPLRRLRGRLVDREGDGVPGARIAIWRSLGGWCWSDEDGRFDLILPAGGEVLGITVAHSGFLPMTVPLPEVSAGEREIRLSRGVDLTLDVRCDKGRDFGIRFEDPVSGKRIYEGSGRKKEREGGVVWHWAHAPAGTVRVLVRPKGGESIQLSYRAEEGGKVELEASIR